MHDRVGALFGSAFCMYHQTQGAPETLLLLFLFILVVYRSFEHINKPWMVQLGDFSFFPDN